jgi:hypothetical protein
LLGQRMVHRKHPQSCFSLGDTVTKTLRSLHELETPVSCRRAPHRLTERASARVPTYVEVVRKGSSSQACRLHVGAGCLQAVTLWALGRAIACMHGDLWNGNERVRVQPKIVPKIPDGSTDEASVGGLSSASSHGAWLGSEVHKVCTYMPVYISGVAIPKQPGQSPPPLFRTTPNGISQGR